MPSLAGTTLDKYDMIEEVGHGGMAVVYRGRDQVLDREVAVKVLHPHLADREESRLRLQREAIAVAKLRHENILEIFDYSGPEAAESYIVTEFIHGPTLREWIEKDVSPRPAVAAMLVHRLCQALCHAHRGGIVHRDIKPENVMIRAEDGVLKLMDFGIAQIVDNQKLTLTGQLIGSPAYMAPELISGRPLDQRTDLFSIGILLYQLATGELPFSGRNPHEVLTRIADGHYPPPSTVSPLVDRDLEEIIDRALALNPDERYQSVETFAKELEQYLAEMGLEPNSIELGRYFHDPEAYIGDLDKQVCAALLERAQAAAAEAATARAIRLLGRVLELDPGHGGAKAMLERLKARERRSRQLLLGAAFLAVAGLVGAGYMLVPPPVSGSQVAATDLSAGTGGEDPTRDSVSAGDALEGPQPAADAGAEVDPTAAVSLPPDDGGALAMASADAGADAASFSEADAGVDEAGADAAGGADAGEAGADAGTAADARPGDPPRPRIRKETVPGTRPKVRGKEPSGETVTCELEFSGLNASAARNARAQVAGRTFKLTSRSLRVEMPAEGGRVSVVSSRYAGQRVVRPGDCEAGPVVVDVRPLPAKLNFTGLDPDVAAICTKGCAGLVNKSQLAASFPAMDLGDDEFRSITVRFRHPDYKTLTRDFNIHPGTNSFEVDLKLDNG